MRFLFLSFFLLLLSACSEDNSTQDSDGDGANDHLDLFPDDAARAFRVVGAISGIRGQVTLVLNEQEIVKNSAGEFQFDIPYGEVFTLYAESSLDDELCLVSNPTHDAKTAIEALEVSCIERTDINLALNSITNSYLRFCIEEQGANWVDEVVEIDCKNTSSFTRACMDKLEEEFNPEELDIFLPNDDCLPENLDNADGIEQFTFLKKLFLKFGTDSLGNSETILGFIDLTSNVLLEELEIEVADLDVTGLGKLKRLFLTGYDGETINLEEMKNLESLLLHAPDLKRVDLNTLNKLEYAGGYFPQLTEFDISELYGLKAIIISSSQLENLDTSSNIHLEWLFIWSSKLKALSISNNKKLKELNIWGNELETLNVSNNSNLTNLDLTSNKFETVPLGIRSIKDKSATINLERNPLSENAKAELKELQKEYSNLVY